MKIISKVAALLVFSIFFLTACAGKPNSAYKDNVKDIDKSAALTYTEMGPTSFFEFKGIASGTYKSLGNESGMETHAGARSVELTIDAAQHWAATAESKRQDFQVPGIDFHLHNPYVATLIREGQDIGAIGISISKIRKTEGIINYMGLDDTVQKNLHLTGRATILGRDYEIESVYEKQNGKKIGAPLGYQVSLGSKILGMVQVGKNSAGSHEMTLQIKPNLDPEVEQSVVSMLLVCGYAV